MCVCVRCVRACARVYTQKRKEGERTGPRNYEGWNIPVLAVAKWKSKTVDGLVSVWKPERLTTHKKLIYRFESKSWTEPVLFLSTQGGQAEVSYTWGRVGILFSSARQLAGWNPSTLGRAICSTVGYWFKCSTQSVIPSQKHP